MRRTTQILTFVAMLVGYFASAADAAAPRCAPRALALNTLSQTYGEERQIMGLNSRGVVEVFASDSSGSWTITVTTPEGMMCIVAAGEAFLEDPGPAVSGRGV